MSSEFNAENRNANISIRFCSFCRRGGHNITRCNSEPIHIFENEITNYINNIMPLRIEDCFHLESINHYLINRALHDSNIIKVFAISRCGANTRSDILNCIQLIIQYFMPQIQISRLYTIMLIEMLRTTTIIESDSLNRKFDIKTKISENTDNLEKKCECNICYEEVENKNFVKLNCGHEFCKDCIKQSLQNEIRQTPCCAFCRSDIKNVELKLETIKNEFNELIITS